jgi:hypothetical protein
VNAFTWQQFGVLAVFMVAAFLCGWLWRDESAYEEHRRIEETHERNLRRINRYRTQGAKQ